MRRARPLRGRGARVGARRRRAARRARCVRRERGPVGARPVAVGSLGRGRVARRRPRVPAGARRSLGARRGVRRAGALRQPGPARAPARACARLGPGRRAARPARVHARRAARPRSDRVRPRPARSRLADHLPRPRHAARHPDHRRDDAAARRARVGGHDAGPLRERPRRAAAPRARRAGLGRRSRSDARFATDTGAHLLDVDPLAAAERVATAPRA